MHRMEISPFRSPAFREFGWFHPGRLLCTSRGFSFWVHSPEVSPPLLLPQWHNGEQNISMGKVQGGGKRIPRTAFVNPMGHLGHAFGWWGTWGYSPSELLRSLLCCRAKKLSRRKKKILESVMDKIKPTSSLQGCDGAGWKCQLGGNGGLGSMQGKIFTTTTFCAA